MTELSDVRAGTKGDLPRGTSIDVIIAKGRFYKLSLPKHIEPKSVATTDPATGL